MPIAYITAKLTIFWQTGRKCHRQLPEKQFQNKTNCSLVPVATDDSADNCESGKRQNKVIKT
jgi:hypothetical protein